MSIAFATLRRVGIQGGRRCTTETAREDRLSAHIARIVGETDNDACPARRHTGGPAT
jgi:hypothetical protein